MSNTLGAPFGGTTRGAHHGVELRGLLLDHTAECRIGRRKLFSVNGGGGAGRTWNTGGLLSQC